MKLKLARHSQSYRSSRSFDLLYKNYRNSLYLVSIPILWNQDIQDIFLLINKFQQFCNHHRHHHHNCTWYNCSSHFHDDQCNVCSLCHTFDCIYKNERTKKEWEKWHNLLPKNSLWLFVHIWSLCVDKKKVTEPFIFTRSKRKMMMMIMRWVGQITVFLNLFNWHQTKGT